MMRTLPDLIANRLAKLSDTDEKEEYIDTLLFRGFVTDMDALSILNFVESKLVEVQSLDPNGGFFRLLAKAQDLSSFNIPQSLANYWMALEHKPVLELIQCATGLRHLPISSHFDPPEWVKGKDLTFSRTDMKSVSIASHWFEEDYLDWYAEMPEEKRSSGDRVKDLQVGESAYLDPRVAPGAIQLAQTHGEQRLAILGLPVEVGECPVFAVGDDFEGWSELVGRNVDEWLEREAHLFIDQR